MEVVEKKNKNKRYKPILDGIPDWPVYQLSKNRKEFIEEVAQKTFTSNKKEPSYRLSNLSTNLKATVYREQQRMKRNRWRVDPADEPRVLGQCQRRTGGAGDKDSGRSHKPRQMNFFIVLFLAMRMKSQEILKPAHTGLRERSSKFWFARLAEWRTRKKIRCLLP